MSGDPPASHSHAAAATLPLARRRRRHLSRPWRRRCRRAPEDLFILPEGDPVSDPPLNPRGPARGSLTVGPLGPLVRFDQSPASFLLWPSIGGAPAIAVDERRLPTGSRGQGWIRQSRAVLSVVEGLTGTKGVTGGELHDGRWLQEDWGLELRWLPIDFERWGGSARSRRVEWRRWMDRGGSARDARHRRVVAAELARDEEEGPPPSIAGCGSAMRMA